MSKRNILQKRNRKAKRKAAKQARLLENWSRQFKGSEEDKAEIEKESREAIGEVLERCRGPIEEWALALTEDEKTAIDQTLREDKEPWIVGESLPFKLAAIIDSYELASHPIIDASFIGADGKIDFSKTFTLAELIAETATFNDLPIEFELLT